MRPLLVFLACALVLATPAAAGNLPPAGSGSLSIGPDSVLALGGVVELYADWPGHLNNPRASVFCWQDVNGDGVVEKDIFSADVVYGVVVGDEGYGNFKGKEFYVPLDWYSLWKDRGGPAACRADLYYFNVEGTNREWNGRGQQEIVYLASVEFQAAG